MSNYSGVVRKIFAKTNWGTQSFVIDTVDKTYFNLGKVPPMFTEGQTVSFYGRDGKKAGNVDVDVNTIVVGTETPVATEDYAMGGARRTAAAPVTKDAYWSNKEARDLENDRKRNLGAARNTAIAMAELIHKVTPYTNVLDVATYVNDKTIELSNA